MQTKKLIILEGADGAGKTTLAEKLAVGLDAEVVHHGAYLELSPAELARTYVESMLSALRGTKPVILDRSWLSEPIYGRAYRNGADRIGVVTSRMLERLALRCGAVVVLCDPGWERVVTNWRRRKGEGKEYLDTPQQLRDVYVSYDVLCTDLRLVSYDYTTPPLDLLGMLKPFSGLHQTHVRSAGRWGAPVLLVGDSFGKSKAEDHEYQWPFASFSNSGCSRWLTEKLDAGGLGIGEHNLMWVNADQELTWLPGYLNYVNPKVIALGEVASTRLKAMGVLHLKARHPQYWKRFGLGRKYPLLNLLET